MNYISTIIYGDSTYYIRAASLKSVKSDGTIAPAGTMPKADGFGGITWESTGSGVTSIGNKDGVVLTGYGLAMINDSQTIGIESLPYTTSAPQADRDSNLNIVILTGNPTTYYKGYLYFIQESDS